MQYPICSYHRELINALEHDRIAIAAPRGHSKSTWCSFFYPLFEVLENPGIKILLVSSTGSLAEYWLGEIRKELEINESIKEFYGNQEGDGRWTVDEIQLANGSIIMAKGAGKQIRGFRPDIIIGDDLETDEMVLSTERRKTFDDWFWNTLVGTLRGGEGKVIVVGTILHPESFLAELINKGRHGWKTRFYQALKKDGTSLWPDMWPLEVLTSRRLEMGEYGFAQEYMNDPVPDDRRIFQKKWLKYFDREPEGCVYFTTVDPAFEIKVTNDCTAIVTCAVDNAENLYVVEYLNKRILPSETIDAIFDVYKRYSPAVIGIESVQAQRVLKYQMDKEKKARGLFPVVRDLESGGRRKSMRIEALQPRFEAGKIFIKEGMEELETQLLRFPSPRCHDDIIDALAYQLDIVFPAAKKVAYINPDSFRAHIERKRRNFGSNKFLGNDSVRGI